MLLVFITAFTAVVAATTGETQQPIAITQLPDGVTISSGETLKKVTATWNVFIVLEQPTLPAELAKKVAALDDIFTHLQHLQSKNVRLDMSTQRAKQANMKSMLAALPGARLKRGLLDIGGSILNTLFGVATSSDIGRLTDAINAIAGKNQAVAHAHNQLATVVNQTRRRNPG